MSELGLIRAFLEQATAQGSRSTVLRPIGWMMPICVAATLSAVYIRGPFWLIGMFATFAGLTMLLYLGAYLYCLVTDKEALRSETYSIQKLAIEKGFVGDSVAGVFPAEASPRPALIAAPPETAQEDQK